VSLPFDSGEEGAVTCGIIKDGAVVAEQTASGAGQPGGQGR